MAQVFGLDLGTTNTLAAVRFAGETRPRAFLDAGLPHPSVIQYRGPNPVAGRHAREQLDQAELGVVGDIVRSPKRFLGSGYDIHVGGVAREPARVVADLLNHVRSHAEAELGGAVSLERVVATIPVGMDGRGRRDLRRAARLSGIEIEQFVHEPLAALYAFAREQESPARFVAELEGQLVLVFDWGGGTLDLTLCRITAGNILQVQNLGDDSVGGDRFDEALLSLVENQYLAQHGFSTPPRRLPHARAQLLVECERAKIRLSERESAQILVAHYADINGPAQVLEAELTRRDLESATAKLVDRGIGAVTRLLDATGVPAESVALCLATGGMVNSPAIRRALTDRFGGPARVPELSNGGTIIGEGAAWIASDSQALRLSKPIEVLQADDAYIPLLGAETELPRRGDQLATRVGMYCVDPRDGFARFLFARPSAPERTAPSDPRNPYGVVVIAVDPNAKPLMERLDLSVAIDDDLVLTAEARSSLRGDARRVEIHDLEFGLKIGGL